MQQKTQPYQYLLVSFNSYICHMQVISVNKNSGVPKYKQIIKSVEESITNNQLKEGDKLPSINSIKQKYSLSRDTVLLAFNELKTRGIIQSVPGKGYYIKSTDLNVTRRIFVLFDELNAFKEDLYKSLLKHLGPSVEVDIYFHHFNKKLFAKLIHDSIGNYNHYILMPANLKNTKDAVNMLPEDKVFILDQFNEELNKYPAVYQNFKKNIYQSLVEVYKDLKKYDTLKLIFSSNKQPDGILFGFELFCKNYQIKSNIHASVEDADLESGDVVLVLDDEDLIGAVKVIKQKSLKIGKSIGIISYNESPLKEIIENGITTFSTDFKDMAKTVAGMILNNDRMQIENKNVVIRRQSL